MSFLKPSRLVMTSVAFCLALSGVACSDAPDTDVEKAKAFASAHKASMSMNACELITKAMVAETFDLPPAQISSSSYYGCEYSLETVGDKTLSVNTFIVAAFPDEATAEAAFLRSTRNMSSEEISAGLEKAKANVEDRGGLDAKDKKMFNRLAKAASGMSINYADVEGIGEYARINTDTGELHVLANNIYFVVSAYYGQPMSLEALQSGSIIEVTKNWTQQTLPQRKKAAKTLAKAAIAEM